MIPSIFPRRKFRSKNLKSNRILNSFSKRNFYLRLAMGKSVQTNRRIANCFLNFAWSIIILELVCITYYGWVCVFAWNIVIVAYIWAHAVDELFVDFEEHRKKCAAVREPHKEDVQMNWKKSIRFCAPLAHRKLAYIQHMNQIHWTNNLFYWFMTRCSSTLRRICFSRWFVRSVARLRFACFPFANVATNLTHYQFANLLFRDRRRNGIWIYPFCLRWRGEL